MKILHNTMVFASLCAVPTWISAHHGHGARFDRTGAAEIAGVTVEPYRCEQG